MLSKYQNNLRIKKYESILINKLNSLEITLLSPYSKNLDKVKLKCKCGVVYFATPNVVMCGDSTSCGCSRRSGYYGEIPGQLWTYIKNSARKRKFKLDITPEYIWILFLKQKENVFLAG